MAITKTVNLNISEKLRKFIEENETLVLRSSLVVIAVLAIGIEILVGGLLSEPKDYLVKEDMYYIWLEGKRISEGINPYEFVLNGDLLNNEKYAAYLPFFYVLSALFHILGITSFNQWVIILRFVMMIFYIGIAYQIFLAFYNRSFPFAVFSVLYWLFNRWTIIVIYVVHIDFVPLFLLIYSLQNIEKNRNKSLFAYGLSLTMKHMAIFLFPMYIMLLFQDKMIHSVKDYLVNIGRIIVIPLTFSIPFMIWNFKAFAYSMIFSGTRVSEELYDELHDVASDDTLLAFGIANRLFMILIMILVLIIFHQRRIGKFTTSFLIFVIFIEFNIVLFDQYRIWRVALLPFILQEFGVFDKKVGIKTQMKLI